jgi:hypothetical protein
MQEINFVYFLRSDRIIRAISAWQPSVYIHRGTKYVVHVGDYAIDGNRNNNLYDCAQTDIGAWSFECLRK